MIDYEEDYIGLLLCRLSGSLVPRAACCAIPSCCLTLIILYSQDYEYGIFHDLGAFDLGGSQLWNAVTVVLTLMLAFRTRQGLMRFWEGTGLLHQMRGEWFDTVSNCVTFSISAKKVKPVEVERFRHTLVRLMSRCHGSALEEIAENCFQLEAIDTFGLDNETLHHLKVCHEVYNFNKVEVMLHLVQSLITAAHDDGILRISPPILSRVYQTISRGFVNLLNAKKITDTRFPFPYVQLISFLLLSHTVLTPLIMCSIMRTKIMAVVMTFVPIIGMATLNFIAIELENPFGTDANDLPIVHFQYEMNLCLLMLLHRNTDLISSVSPGCVMEFDELLSNMKRKRETGTLGRLSTVSFDSTDISRQSTEVDGTKSIVAVESIADHASSVPVSPASEMPAAPVPAPTPQALIVKSIDDFETSMKQWMRSVETQVTQLNQSFNALKTFNETTSELILATDWPNPPNTPRTEGGGWQTAISPV